jgi:type IV secretory pathway TrbD component
MGTERDGLVSPVHHSLVHKQLLGGVAKPAAILNLTVVGALVHLTHVWWLLGVGVLLHVGAYVLTKRDSEFMDVFRRYIKTYRYYDV